MNKEHVKGATDNVVGKTNEVAGHVTGNKKLESESKVDQVKGAVHNMAGDAKDAGKEAIDAVKNAPSGSIEVGVGSGRSRHLESKGDFSFYLTTG